MYRIRARHYYDPELKRTTDGRYACDIYMEAGRYAMKSMTLIQENWKSLMKGVHAEIEDLNAKIPYLTPLKYMKLLRDYKLRKVCLRG